MSPLTPAVFLLFLLQPATPTGRKINPAFLLGATCSVIEEISGRSYSGECRYLQDCPSAVSNLHAGLQPTICLKLERVAVVCCPSERTISDLMCEEWQKLKSGEEDPKSAALEVIGGDDEAPASDDKLPRMITTPNRLPQNRTLHTRHLKDKFRKSKSREEKDEVVVLGYFDGDLAAAKQFPQTVALGFGGEEVEWGATGTLISPQFVLTAARCFRSRRGNLSRVMLGDVRLAADDDPFSTRAEVGVAWALPHPNYTSGIRYNDIALLKLSHPVVLSAAVRPACLPQGKYALEKVRTPDKVITAGWDVDEFLRRETERPGLKFVGLTRVDHTACTDVFEIPETGLELPRGVLRSQFCARQAVGDRDICEGHCGGGLYVNQRVGKDLKDATFVVGVSSFGLDNCGLGSPTVYTNVQSYVPWIESVVWP